jgi:hypothetical protein
MCRELEFDATLGGRFRGVLNSDANIGWILGRKYTFR